KERVERMDIDAVERGDLQIAREVLVELIQVGPLGGVGAGHRRVLHAPDAAVVADDEVAGAVERISVIIDVRSLAVGAGVLVVPAGAVKDIGSLRPGALRIAGAGEEEETRITEGLTADRGDDRARLHAQDRIVPAL